MNKKIHEIPNIVYGNEMIICKTGAKGGKTLLQNGWMGGWIEKI